MRRRTQVSKGVLIPFLAALGLMGCGGRMPDDLGAEQGRLRDCPSSPNCVSSAASPADDVHAIAALRVVDAVGTEAAWAALVEELEARPRVEIVTREPDYLHAVFTTRLMRYRDDVEFLRDEGASQIDVRSASRVGYGDMGSNRARIESLRTALAEAGFVEGVPAEAD
jgi:uncharacterized protein (DUF1499 family)